MSLTGFAIQIFHRAVPTPDHQHWKMDSFLPDLDGATAMANLIAMWDEFDAATGEIENGADLNDVSISKDLQRQEFRYLLTFHLDHLVALHLADDSSNDTNTADSLNDIAHQFRLKTADGAKLAERLFGMHIDLLISSSPDTEGDEKASSVEYLELLRDRATNCHVGTDIDQSNDIGDGAGHHDTDNASSCVCCLTSFTAQVTVTCPCSHTYCHSCLSDFFQRALADVSIFPPTCCDEPIPIENEHVQACLGETLVAEFESKREELGTPNRTYCNVPECAAWIPPQYIDPGNDLGQCPKCQAPTCTICKAAAHEGTECPEDEGTRNILDLAERERWSQCYACHRLVELNTGCYHISKLF